MQILEQTWLCFVLSSSTVWSLVFPFSDLTVRYYVRILHGGREAQSLCWWREWCKTMTREEKKERKIVGNKSAQKMCWEEGKLLLPLFYQSKISQTRKEAWLFTHTFRYLRATDAASEPWSQLLHIFAKAMLANQWNLYDLILFNNYDRNVKTISRSEMRGIPERKVLLTFFWSQRTCAERVPVASLLFFLLLMDPSISYPTPEPFFALFSWTRGAGEELRRRVAFQPEVSSIILWRQQPFGGDGCYPLLTFHLFPSPSLCLLSSEKTLGLKEKERNWLWGEQMLCVGGQIGEWCESRTFCRRFISSVSMCTTRRVRVSFLLPSVGKRDSTDRLSFC